VAVITIHVAAQNWYSADVNTFHWKTFNAFDGAARWSVPVFVMISGALFLNRECGIKQLIKKNITRIITAFFFWSAIYAGVKLYKGGAVSQAVADLFTGQYHMWFLFMIVGLYLVAPFIKKITQSPSLVRYYLCLWVAMSVFVPLFAALLSASNGKIGEILEYIRNSAYFFFAEGYVGYFLLGYLLSNITLRRRSRYLIYLLGSVSLFLTVWLTQVQSVAVGKPTCPLYGYFSVTALLQSIAIFILFRYLFMNLKPGNGLAGVIATLSQCSFGAYLVHVLVLEHLNDVFGINTMTFHPVKGTLFIIFVVTMVSYGISFLLNQIPFLKKYIV